MVDYGSGNQYRIWNPMDNKITVTEYADFINEGKKPIATAIELEKVIYDTIEVLPEPSAISAEMLATPVETGNN